MNLYGILPRLTDVDPTQPPGTEQVQTIINWIGWGVMTLGIVGILIVAAKMMINNRRGEGGENAAGLGWVFGGLILASAAGALVGALV